MDSFISWIGGKKQLRKKIIERFPNSKEIGRYVEVFGGAGWVLFGKERTSGQMEVYNDANSDLVNLFRCVKHHCGELQRELEWAIDSREQFFDAKDQNGCKGMTDIQRAARFYRILKTSFGSNALNFATSGKKFNIEYLIEVQKRLQKVVIEQKDFEDLIKIYDRGNALFYLDPPYVGSEKYYNAEFKKEDHRRLKQCLDGIKGRFLLSYNDSSFIRHMYSDQYKIEEVSRKCTLAGNTNCHDFPELIISNF